MNDTTQHRAEQEQGGKRPVRLREQVLVGLRLVRHQWGRRSRRGAGGKGAGTAVGGGGAHALEFDGRLRRNNRLPGAVVSRGAARLLCNHEHEGERADGDEADDRPDDQPPGVHILVQHLGPQIHGIQKGHNDPQHRCHAPYKNVGAAAVLERLVHEHNSHTAEKTAHKGPHHPGNREEDHPHLFLRDALRPGHHQRGSDRRCRHSMGG
mmetsp:Transcript_2948/g.6975  ORF Transcript_2948/g.6975 Transcript_2948/m.6975 type:complete len:209 (-) Transcript_2948:273-899(-)